MRLVAERRQCRRPQRAYQTLAVTTPSDSKRGCEDASCEERFGRESLATDAVAALTPWQVIAAKGTVGSIARCFIARQSSDAVGPLDARIHGSDMCRGRWRCVRAAVRNRRSRLAVCSAYGCGARAERHGHRDRKDDCSKHWRASEPEEARRAPDRGRRSRVQPAVIGLAEGRA